MLPQQIQSSYAGAGRNHAHAVLSLGPKAFWRLHGDADSQTGFAGGTFNGGVKLGSARMLGRDPATAMDFNGTDGYMATTWDGLLFTNPVTVLGWLKTSAAGHDHGLVAWGDSTTDGGKWHMRLEDNLSPVGALRVECQGGFKRGDTALNDGARHQVGFTFDGVAMSNATLYVDGAPATIAASSDQSVFVETGADVTVGRRTQAGTNYYFDGQIQEVAIWDRALSAAEIAWLYAIATGGRTQWRAA